jgi:hypothetical protein
MPWPSKHTPFHRGREDKVTRYAGKDQSWRRNFQDDLKYLRGGESQMFGLTTTLKASFRASKGSFDVPKWLRYALLCVRKAANY